MNTWEVARWKYEVIYLLYKQYKKSFTLGHIDRQWIIGKNNLKIEITSCFSNIVWLSSVLLGILENGTSHTKLILKNFTKNLFVVT